MNITAKQVHCEITSLTDSDLFVLLDNHRAKFDYPVHYHRDYELNIVLKTEGQRIVADSVEDFDELDIVLIGPNVAHAWRGETTDDTHVITIMFEEYFADRYIEGKTIYKPIHDLLVRSRNGIHFTGNGLGAIVTKCKELSRSKGFVSSLLFFEILQMLSQVSLRNQRILGSTSYSNADVIRKSKSRRIEKICSYIEDNYPKNIALEDIAELVNMSPSAASHFFKKHTNRTLSSYVIEIRVGHASRMLFETTRPINDIAYECGFGNISNFNRTFKKYKNKTPREYRIEIEDTIIRY